MSKPEHNSRKPRPTPRLSPRQQQCLVGILDLKSAKQIARELGISPHAVEKHLKIAREKYGVATSAEAARLFAHEHRGREFPQSGVPDLPRASGRAHERGVLDSGAESTASGLEDTNGVLSADRPLTPVQTLLTIAAVSLGSIVGLLLLVACAEGIRALVSN